MIKKFPKLIKDSLMVNYQDIYKTVSLPSLVNTYSILYFSQINFFFNNYPTILKYTEKILGKKAFYFVIQKTLGK